MTDLKYSVDDIFDDKSRISADSAGKKSEIGYFYCLPRVA